MNALKKNRWVCIGFNICIICLDLNWFFYDLSLKLPKFVWMLYSSVWVVFNSFLLIDATERSKINSASR